MIRKDYKMRKKVRRIGMMVLLALLLSGCRQGDKTIELTKYTGNSVESFVKKTGFHLSNVGSGNYVQNDVVHVNATKSQMMSITLLEDAEQRYTIYDVYIGMEQAAAEKTLKEQFKGTPLEYMTNEKNVTCMSYTNEKREVKVTYDNNTKLVKEITVVINSDKTMDDNYEEDGNLIVMIGKIKVYYNEAMVYLKSIQENYETGYGRDIWNCDIYGDGTTFGDIIKDEIIKQIMEIKIICAKADEQGITLTEEELAEARKLAREHYAKFTPDEVSKYKFSEELFVRVYNDNILAEKAYETVTLNVDTNIPDYDAKQITIQHIFRKNTKEGEAGAQEKLPENEQNNVLEKMETLHEKALETKDFLALAEANSEDTSLTETFGRANAPERYDDTYIQTAFSLKTGEVSDVIATENGWYILYCVNEYDEDATLSYKEQIIEARRSEMFTELYTEWSKNYDVIVNSEAWKSMIFD